jgi:hypothetical protein
MQSRKFRKFSQGLLHELVCGFCISSLQEDDAQKVQGVSMFGIELKNVSVSRICGFKAFRQMVLESRLEKGS